MSGPTINPLPKDAATGETLAFASPAAAMFGVPPPPTQDPPMRNYRGNTLGQSYYFRERMKISREKPMMGYWFGAFAYTGVARAIGQAGFDYVVVDWEHTPMSIDGICEIIRWINYASEGSTAVIVRVPGHEHWPIAWVLDAGASAVILPHTETVEQAKQAVKNARFPMYGGTRSGPPNAFLMGYNDGAPGGGGATEAWNRAAVIMQIESEVGSKNADAIAAVEGVDGVMVGPGDLALDLQVPLPKMAGDPKWNSCVDAVSAAAKKHNKAAFMPSLAPLCTPWLERGFTMVACGNDGVGFTKMLRESLTEGHKQLNAWKEKNGQAKEGANGQ